MGELGFSSPFTPSAAGCSDELGPCSEDVLEASTNGTFSLTGEGGSAALPDSSVESVVGGGAPLKPRAISSNVRPFVSGTRKYVKMKNMTRKIVNMMKTYGPQSSCDSPKNKELSFKKIYNGRKNYIMVRIN